MSLLINAAPLTPLFKPIGQVATCPYSTLFPFPVEGVNYKIYASNALYCLEGFISPDAANASIPRGKEGSARAR